jgi:hypothetical protein
MLKLAAKYVLGDNSVLTCEQLKATFGRVLTPGSTNGGHRGIDVKLEVIARGQEPSQTSNGSCAFLLPTAIPSSAIAARSGN